MMATTTGTELTGDARAARWLRLAALLLLVHAAANIGSGFAFATFLSPPFPAWLSTPTNMKVYAFLYKWAGQATVITGALACVLHLQGRLGARSAWTIFGVGFSIALASELSGTITGLPFGPYVYTPNLGYRIFGHVPLNLPTSWFYMIYASLAIVGRLLAARDDGATKWWWAFVASFVMTAWDVSMDPAMVSSTHWIWQLAPAETMGPLQRLIGSAVFYTMPLTNWLGWLVIATLIARVVLAFVPPTRWARDLAWDRFPLVLYAVNGILPLGICLGRELWAGFWWGAVAMGVPLLLAVLARRPATVTTGLRAASPVGDVAIAR
jgi:putative membrane protein